MSVNLLRNNKVNYLTSNSSTLVYANNNASYVNFEFLIYNRTNTQSNFNEYFITPSNTTASQINCLNIHPKRYVDKLIYSVRPFVFLPDITSISDDDTYAFHVDVYTDSSNTSFVNTFKLTPQNINSNCLTEFISIQGYVEQISCYITCYNHTISTKSLYKININDVEIGEIIVM